MSEIDSDSIGSWLSPEDLEYVRHKVPMVYVDIVPVRVDEHGVLQAVGMLLCADDEGISRAFPSGRILFHESVREALLRHIEKDLGPVALPQLPVSAGSGSLRRRMRHTASATMAAVSGAP